MRVPTTTVIPDAVFFFKTIKNPLYAPIKSNNYKDIPLKIRKLRIIYLMMSWSFILC